MTATVYYIYLSLIAYISAIFLAIISHQVSKATSDTMIVTVTPFFIVLYLIPVVRSFINGTWKQNISTFFSTLYSYVTVWYLTVVAVLLYFIPSIFIAILCFKVIWVPIFMDMLIHEDEDD